MNTDTRIWDPRTAEVGRARECNPSTRRLRRPPLAEGRAAFVDKGCPSASNGRSVLTLYTASFSSNGRKAVALLRQLGVAAEIVEVNVYRGEGRAPSFLALNPFGKVPTLVDGELTLTESNAILVYLAEAYGRSRFFARTAGGRAEILRWMFWESAHWQPTLTQVLRLHAGHIMVPSLIGPPSGEPQWSASELVALLRQLERRLAISAHLAGDEPTLADFSVAAMTIYFRRLGFPFASYPALAAWYARVHGLSGWRSTSEEPWLT